MSRWIIAGKRPEKGVNCRLDSAARGDDIRKFAETIEFQWFNQTLCKVNNSVVRVWINEGEYHWHEDDRDDEFFHVISGRLLIDLEERVIDLSPGQALVVSKGGFESR
jgi:mannose-6-phosphate isomerase-like protein (cupin superfamily)